MNSCVLMAKIVKSPELRYTPDNQLAVANMMVEFETLGANDSLNSHQLKVVGWGSLATEINDQYQEGDEVIMEGRLAMNTFDRPEGFKEKRAEFVVSRIFAISNTHSPTPKTSVSPNNVVPFQNTPKSVPSPSPQPLPNYDQEESSPSSDQNLDDIPF